MSKENDLYEGRFMVSLMVFSYPRKKSDKPVKEIGLSVRGIPSPGDLIEITELDGSVKYYEVQQRIFPAVTEFNAPRQQEVLTPGMVKVLVKDTAAG